MHASKFVTYIVVGLVTLLTRLAISALPGGQLNDLLDQLFAIVHAAGVNYKEGEKNQNSYISCHIEEENSNGGSIAVRRWYKPVVGQSLHRTRDSCRPPFLCFGEVRPQ